MCNIIKPNKSVLKIISRCKEKFFIFIVYGSAWQHSHSFKKTKYVHFYAAMIIECIENWINWDVMMSNYLIMTRVTLSFEQLIDWKIIEPIEFWIMFKWCLLCSIYYVAFFAKIVVDCDYKLAIVLVVWSVDDYEMSGYRLMLGWCWILRWNYIAVDWFNTLKIENEESDLEILGSKLANDN